MNRLKTKTTATLLIAIFMISTFAVMVSAGAQKGWGKPEVRVRANGQFTSMWPGGDYGYPSTEGHECFVNIQTRRVTDGWTGRGVFWDKNYEDGKLIAVIKVDTATETYLPDYVTLHGTVEVSVNDVYIGTYSFNSMIVPSWYLTFEIPGLNYLAHVYGDDIPVDMTIDFLEYP